MCEDIFGRLDKTIADRSLRCQHHKLIRIHEGDPGCSSVVIACGSNDMGGYE